MSNKIEAFLRWLTGSGANVGAPRAPSEPGHPVRRDFVPTIEAAPVPDVAPSMTPPAGAISSGDAPTEGATDAAAAPTASSAVIEPEAEAEPAAEATIEGRGEIDRIAGAAQPATDPEDVGHATIVRAGGAEAVADDTVDHQPDPVLLAEEPIEIRIETAGAPAAPPIKPRPELIRALFNDFWSDRLDKPAAFADRLNEAETYLNQRLEANGEVWRLDAGTRELLGLPPRAQARSHAGMRAHH
jgi:hypothetical protein